MVRRVRLRSALATAAGCDARLYAELTSSTLSSEHRASASRDTTVRLE